MCIRDREKARHKSQALQVWQEARSENNFEKFQPYLEKTVELTCKTAEYYGYEDNIYDALLDIYEPGMTVAQLDPLFTGLREAIVPLVKAVGESPNQPDTSFLDIGKFSEEKQRQFSMKVAEVTSKAFFFSRFIFSKELTNILILGFFLKNTL